MRFLRDVYAPELAAQCAGRAVGHGERIYASGLMPCDPSPRTSGLPSWREVIRLVLIFTRLRLVSSSSVAIVLAAVRAYFQDLDHQENNCICFEIRWSSLSGEQPQSFEESSRARSVRNSGRHKRHYEEGLSSDTICFRFL